MRIKRLLTIGILIGVFSLTTAHASNDNIGFKFRIKSYYTNGINPDGRFRQTNSTINPWKVRLVKSGEGKGTYTNFWMERSDGENLSNDIKAKQGAKKASYDQPKSKANRKTCYLAGENNNFNGDSYTVTGVWDEETW